MFKQTLIRNCAPKQPIVSFLLHYKSNPSTIQIWLSSVATWSYRDTIFKSVSKCHMVATWWLGEGLSKSCCLPKAIGQLRVTIVLSLCGDNAHDARCRQLPNEVKTTVTQTDRMSTNWYYMYDGHTENKMNTIEFNMNIHLPNFIFFYVYTAEDLQSEWLKREESNTVYLQWFHL